MSISFESILTPVSQDEIAQGKIKELLEFIEQDACSADGVTFDFAHRQTIELTESTYTVTVMKKTYAINT